MEIGISTALFYDESILAVLPTIKEAGFNVVEIWAGAGKYGAFSHFNWHKDLEIKSLEVCIRGLGIRVESLHSPFSPTIDLSSPDDAIRTFSVSEVERSMYCMKQLGGKILIVHPASSEQSLKDNISVRFSKCRQSLESLYIRAEDLGVKLAIETQLPHVFGGEIAVLKKLIEGFSVSVCGFCFDTSHTNLWQKGCINAFEKLSMTVNSFHISDNNGTNDNHFVPGDGNINWRELVHLIKKTNCSDIFMLEILGAAREIEPGRILSRAHKNAFNILNGIGFDKIEIEKEIMAINPPLKNNPRSK